MSTRSPHRRPQCGLRVESVEELARQKGRELAGMTLNELDELWEVVKKGSTH